MTTALPRVTLVLGGARSGKSRYAEALVHQACGGVYLATAQALDDEMAARIARHRAERDTTWITIEEPLELGAALEHGARMGRPILIDCLTLWVSNLLGAGRTVEAETSRLLHILRTLAVPVVFVSNEVGLGIVPDNALARAFRDEAGRLNQAIAAAADRVVFLAAGLPLVLKGSG
jgi:adenosylcobinamide kinase/adenosylcobinamide-phosphate guanylyltransferase